MPLLQRGSKKRGDSNLDCESIENPVAFMCVLVEHLVVAYDQMKGDARNAS